MMNKVQLYQLERFDLPDAIKILEYQEDEFQGWVKSLFTGASQSWIVNGFEPSVVTNLLISVSTANAVVFNGAGTGDLSGSMFNASSTSAVLSLTLTNNASNYVHLVLEESGDTADVRVFWDPTANNGVGGEYNQIVNTTKILTASLYVSITGWSTDPNKIPLFIATTSGGAVTALTDYRNLMFRLGRPGNSAYTNFLTDRIERSPDKIIDSLAFTFGDKEIKNIKQWMDVVMSAIKEIKWGSGTGYWYQQAPASLTQGNDVLTAGGTWSWNLSAGPGSSGDITFDANAVIMMYGSAYTNTVDYTVSSPITMDDGDVAYVDLDRTSNATITVTVVASTLFTSDPDRLIIAKRIADTVYIGNTPLILDDGDSGTLSIAITSAFATYVGAPSFSPPAPDYNASGIAPATVVYITNSSDNLTLAIAKHDVVMQAMALQLVPIGSIIPFYDFNGLVTFSTTYWKYCNGTAIVSASSPLNGQTAPDMSNRYLVGFGTEAAGDIGTAPWSTAVVGNASHQINIAHTHTGPSHTHSETAHTHTVGAHYHGVGTLSVVLGGSHYHTVSSTTDASGAGSINRLGNGDGSSTTVSTSTGGSHTHSLAGSVGYTSGVNGDSAITTSSGTGGTTGASGTGATSSALSSTQSVQPRSIRVRFIMRIL